MYKITGIRIYSSTYTRAVSSRTKKRLQSSKLQTGDHFQSRKLFFSSKNSNKVRYYCTKSDNKYLSISKNSLIPRTPIDSLKENDAPQNDKKTKPYATTYRDLPKDRIKLTDDTFSYTLFMDENGKTRRVDEEERSKVIPRIEENTYKHSDEGTPLTLPRDLVPSSRDIYSKEMSKEEDVKSVFGKKYRPEMAQKVILNGKEHPCGFVWYGAFHPSMRAPIEALGRLYTEHGIPSDRRIPHMPFYHYTDAREMFVACTPHMNAAHIEEAEARAKETADKIFKDPDVEAVVLQTYLSVLRWDGHETFQNSGEASHARSAIDVVRKDGSRSTLGALESTGALNHPERGKRTHSPSSESNRLPSDYAVDRAVTKEGEDYSMLIPRVPGHSSEIKNMFYFSKDMHTQLPQGGWYSDSIVKEKPLSRESLEKILSLLYLVKTGTARIYGEEIPNPNSKFKDTVPLVRKMSHPTLGFHGQGSGATNCITMALYMEKHSDHIHAGKEDFGFKDFPALGSTNETFATVLLDGAKDGSSFFDTKGNRVARDDLEDFLGSGIKKYLHARDSGSLAHGVEGISGERSKEGVDRIINWTKPRYLPREVANTFFQWDGKEVPDERVLETMRDYVRDAGRIAGFSTEEINRVLSLFPKPEEGSS